MDIEEFKSSIINEHPPQGLTPLLLALWYDAKGNWEKSHDIISEIESREAALIHAYLHRKEGDLWNADYWYQRAAEKRPQKSLSEEWITLIQRVLSKN